MPTDADLASELRRIDGRGYKAYRDIEGAWSFPQFALFVDHVQGDPFAAPSRLRARVPMDVALLPPALFDTRTRRIALEDFLGRAFAEAIGTGRGDRVDGKSASQGSGKSGLISIDAGGQTVLERTAIVLSDEWVEARIEVGLPAAGRRVMGRSAETLLTERLPRIVAGALRFDALDANAAHAFVASVENQEAIRAELDARGLIAFVGNGAVLPRESGASERPMRRAEAVPFETPEAFAVALALPNPIRPGNAERSEITGMGIPRGVTLIVGGGYHGKSTLLRALECGVHPHVPGDGREWVVAAPDVVKVRAEDGRSVAGVDISAFIGALPSPASANADGGRRTDAFSSDDASGSTSQATNIVEAIEMGATGLLLDEDTSATNFMIRDARMQALVAPESEPITPFLDRVRALHDEHGVSTVLVMGGSGDYFDVADRVVLMRDFAAHDATADARAIARDRPTGRSVESAGGIGPVRHRMPIAESFALGGGRGRRDRVSAKNRELILFGRTPIDLRDLSQIADASQTRAIALALRTAAAHIMGDDAACAAGSAPSLAEILDALEHTLDAEGLDALADVDRFGPRGHHPGNLARPRRFEIAAAINRYRGLRVRQR